MTQRDYLNLIPGTRIVKTIAAIAISLIIAMLLNLDAATMTIIALFSITRSYTNTKELAKARFKGTLFASIYTYFVILIVTRGWMLAPKTFLYNIVVIIFLLGLMEALLFLRVKNAFIYAVIVYLGLMLGNAPLSPLMATIRELGQTCITIIICLKVESSKGLAKLGLWLEKQRNIIDK